MKRVPFRLSASLLLMGAALSGAASAQDLTAYRTLAAQLDAASASAGGDSLVTLKHLDSAQTALDKLSPTIGSRPLAANLQDTMNAIRAAQGRTPAELQAQVHLARGLMRQALYDQTMSLLATAPGNGSAQLELLAQEFGMSTSALTPDLRAGKLNVVAWRVQKNAANKLSLALNNVEPQATPAAYLRLARAASWFPILQEAGKSVQPPLQSGQFTQALSQVAGGDTAALKTSLSQLRAGVAALNTALKQSPTSAPGTSVKTGGGGGQPPVVAPPRTSSAPTLPDHGAKNTAGQPAAAPASPGVAAVYASLGRALSAAARADLDSARAELTRTNAALAALPAALRGTDGYDALVRHVQQMSTRQALRPVDVQALMTEFSALEARPRLSGSALDTAAQASSRLMGGGVRAVLALLLSLFGLVPLYLLNLAFGGRNPYWRAISGALVLLLVPTLADGLFGALGWLGDLLNIPALRGLLRLTPGQSALGVPLRLLATAAALALATYGFRGLCDQLGLLKRKPGAALRSAGKASPQNLKQTILDWDEEV